ncbi:MULTISPECIES: phosphopantetheine-binding protein [unclassified Micromonospora]|uniref:phosphopantetheine-binding protein n=1 Tax=unclassified Micromonospora TaxID=2617518 RepID=UPI003A86E7BA
MAGTTVPTALAEAVRRNLPLLSQDVPITDDLDLVAAGLDSLAMISLLVEVEDQFGVQIPDNRLSAATFTTPRALWSIIAELDASVAPADMGESPTVRTRG